MTYHDTITSDDLRLYREAYVQDQLARAGGYMEISQATSAIRGFIFVTQDLMQKYEVPVEQDWDIDIHSGVITYE